MSNKIYSRYDLPGHPGYTFSLPTMTQQQFKDECDINNILKRYVQTGIMPQPKGDVFFGDFSEALDYRQALDALSQAQDAFDLLPATTRREFDNDPYKLLEFLENPANKDRAIELKLIEPELNMPVVSESLTTSAELTQPSATKSTEAGS